MLVYVDKMRNVFGVFVKESNNGPGRDEDVCGMVIFV